MNIEELKQLAEAATPGPWREVTTLENGFFEVIGDSKRVAHAFGNCRQEAIDNRRYIAAANPAAILELIRQRDELLAALKGVVDDIQALTSESEGVTGLHRNGDIAPWDELVSGGRFERLTSLDDAVEAIAKAEG